MLVGQNVDAGIVGCGRGCGTHVNIGPTGIPNTDIDPGRDCTLSAGVSVTGTVAGVSIVALAANTGAYIDIGNGVGGNEYMGVDTGVPKEVGIVALAIARVGT